MDPPTVIALKNSATRRVVLYPISGVPYLTISADVKAKWAAVRLPDAVDIHRHLVEKGLKADSGAGAGQRAAPRRGPTAAAVGDMADAGGRGGDAPRGGTQGRIRGRTRSRDGT